MIVYHSTQANFALAILREGFSLDKAKYGFGSAKGRAVYCAPTVRGTAVWYDVGPGEMVTLCCELRSGVRIAWVEKEYDQRLIDRLRREFGKDILHSPQTFRRACPRNKQLTKDEMLALMGYFFHNRNREAEGANRRYRKYRQNWWRQNFPYLRQELVRHQFNAIGDRSERAWDSEEIAVFNPADIVPVSAHHLDLSGWDWDAPCVGEPRLLRELSMAELIDLANLEEKRQRRMDRDDWQEQPTGALAKMLSCCDF